MVRDTQGQESDGKYGLGVQVQDGANVEVSRSLFERNRDIGVFSFGNGTILSLTDTIVRETLGRNGDRQFGRGLEVQEGAIVEVSRAVFERNREFGVYAIGDGTILNLTDVIVRETQSQENDRLWGRGLSVQEGAQVTVNRAVFERNRDVGVKAAHAGTILSLTDVIVRETQSRESDGMGGAGLAVQQGAQVEVSRAVFERNRDVGVLAGHADTILSLTDVIVRETQHRESDGMGGGGGAGLHVQNGAHAEVSRSLFERNRSVGVVAGYAGTILSLTDVIVRETQSRESDGWFGRGLNVQEGANVKVIRALFRRNREIGVVAFSAGTILNLTDVVVCETLERECAKDTCADFGDGSGIASLGGAHIEINRFLVSQSALCGIQLAIGSFINEQGESISYEYGGTMDLYEGEVSHNPIGVNIQTEDFDIDRLMDSVIYRENERNLDTNQLPVPGMGIEDIEVEP